MSLPLGTLQGKDHKSRAVEHGADKLATPTVQRSLQSILAGTKCPAGIKGYDCAGTTTFDRGEA